MVSANFSKLDRILDKMGIDTLTELEELPTYPENSKGMTVEELSQYLVFNPENKAIKFRGSDHAPILYIKGQTFFKRSWGLPKFHFLWCQTLNEKLGDGTFNRYVLVPATGETLHHIFQLSSGKRQLDVCQNCLAQLKLAWDIDIPFRNFNLPDVLGQYEPRLKQKPASEFLLIRKDGYPDNWNKISYQYRNSQNWTCERCNVNLNNHRGLLHTHHKNSVTHDTDSRNLEALCIVCHDKEHKHNIGLHSNEKAIIQDLRKQP